jgi:hypothetical protein
VNIAGIVRANPSVSVRLLSRRRAVDRSPHRIAIEYGMSAAVL